MPDDFLTEFIKSQTGGRAPGRTPKSYGSTLTQDDLEGVLREAGWDEKLIPTMSAIGMAESNGRLNAYNPGVGAGGRRTVEQSIGPWQINMHPSLGRSYDRQRLQSDPVYNAQVAKEIYGTQGLKAWGAYTDGRYRQHLRNRVATPTPPVDFTGNFIQQQASQPGPQSAPQPAAPADFTEVFIKSQIGGASPSAPSPTFPNQTPNIQIPAEQNPLVPERPKMRQDVDELGRIGESIKDEHLSPDVAFEQFITTNKLPRDNNSVALFNADVVRRNAESQAQTEAAKAKAEADFRSQPGYADYKKFLTASGDEYKEGSPESIQAFNAHRQRQQASIQKVNRQSGAVARQQAGAQEYDFVKKGYLVLPPTMGQEPVHLSFDKEAQKNLKHGEYRLIDAEGTPFIFIPKTGSIADESSTQVVKEVDVPLLAKDTPGGRKLAERMRAAAIADAIAPDYKDVPREDIVDFFAQAGFVDWKNKGKLPDERFYESATVDPLTGLSKTQGTEKHHITQLDINRLQAFSKERAETRAVYEASKAKYAEQGIDEYVAEVDARRDAKWIDSIDAKEEKAAYHERKQALDASGRVRGLGMAEFGVDADKYGQEWAQNEIRSLKEKYGSFKAAKEADEAYAKLPLSQKIKSAVGATVQVLTKGAASVSKVAGAIQYGVNNLFTNIPQEEYAKLEDTLFYEAGQEWEKLGEWLAPIDPAAKDHFTTKTIDTIGQVATMIGLTYATGGVAAGGIYGASMGAAGQMDEGGREGATPEQRLILGTVGALAAMPDMLLLKVGFGHLTQGQKVSWLRALGASVATKLAPKVGEEAAEQVARQGIRGLIERLAARGQKVITASRSVASPNVMLAMMLPESACGAKTVVLSARWMFSLALISTLRFTVAVGVAFCVPKLPPSTMSAVALPVIVVGRFCRIRESVPGVPVLPAASSWGSLAASAWMCTPF
jgi:hypothetical protein